MVETVLARDTTGEVHVVDQKASEERREDLPQEDSSIVVSECTRDVLVTDPEDKQVVDDETEMPIQKIENHCNACRYATKN